MFHQFLPALALSLVLAACMPTGPIGPLGGGSKHDIESVQIALAVQSGLSVAVAVIDDRPEVVSGEKSEQFVGTERGQWAQTNDIKTLSGRPLAEDLGLVIADTLARSGVAVTPVALRRGTPVDEMLAAFQTQGADRLLAVRLQEWRTDSYTRVHLQWRLEAAVYDRSGQSLGRSSSGGKAPVGTTVSAESGNTITIRELSRKLTNLLEEPAITRALR